MLKVLRNEKNTMENGFRKLGFNVKNIKEIKYNQNFLKFYIFLSS